MQLEGGILDGGGIPLGEVCLDGADDIIHGAASVSSEVQQSEAQSRVVMFTTAPVQSCLCWCMYRGWISLTSSAAPSRHHAMCGSSFAPHGVASVGYTPDLSCARLRAPLSCVLLCYLYNDINTNWIPLANISNLLAIYLQSARKYLPSVIKYL